MASAQGTAPDAEAEGASPARHSRRPRSLLRDPLILLGVCVASGALVSYWWLFVRVATPRPGDEVASLSAVVGEVRRKPVRQEGWTAARVSERIGMGDVVQTEPQSAAEITFDRGSVVRVRPASVVHIGGSAESSTAAWRVQAGRVNFSAGAHVTEILTPTVRTTAGADATGDIDVHETGATGVKIFRGQARVETKLEQRITLGENEAVQVDSAGRAGAKVALPPPPVLIAPPSSARLPADSAARLAWTAVPRGASYRLAVDYNVLQAELLLSASLDQPGIVGTEHALAGLAPGRYFWRVAAVNAQGLEGAFSRVSLFAVIEPEPTPVPRPSLSPPPLLALEVVEEVAPGVVHLEGRTEPGAALSVNGAPIRVLRDGSFSEYVQSGPARTLIVRSSAADGRVSERSRALERR